MDFQCSYCCEAIGFLPTHLVVRSIAGAPGPLGKVRLSPKVFLVRVIMNTVDEPCSAILGVHYGLTIRDWHMRWLKNKPEIIKKYPERLWKIWDVFLAWSTKIALQGSSTVFMITLTKNTLGDKRTFPKGPGAPAMDRTTKWVGRNPIASQQ
jgi:hypothetical protein